MCTALSFSFASSTASTNVWLVKKEPVLMERLTRVYSWYTTRPAPRFRWPTSELPICSAGRPTEAPEPRTKVRG